MRLVRVGLIALMCGLGVAALVSGCGGGSDNNGFVAGPVPVITSVNGSTSPSSPPGGAIELTGTNFGTTPGTVRFTQNGVNTDVVSPVASGSGAGVASGTWTDTSILVTVPATLAAPGSASVAVLSATGGISSSVPITIVTTPSFTPSNVTWTTTQPLPAPLRAHSAVSLVNGTPTTARVYVIGGNNGTANVSSVISAPMDQNAAIVGSFINTSPLPAPRAFAATAVATASNAPVPIGTDFIYVIGGQQTATDAPGGTSTVFVGAVNPATGEVTWTSTSALPEVRVGASAAVSNGWLYVTGGLDPSGNTIGRTASAPIQTNGTLGTFTSSTSTLPTPVAFHRSFAFGGFLYVIGGDTGPQTNPFTVTATSATANTWFAPIRQGTVGTWQSTGGLIKPREKFVLFDAFGQVLVYEGAYGATNFEGERSTIGSDGQLSSFNGQTGSTTPNLNVFNAAGARSPVLTSQGNPSFLIVGGDRVTAPGTLSSTIVRGGP